MWLVASIIANIFIMLVEYVYRSRLFDTFWVALPYIIIPIFIIQLSLFYSFRGASSYLLAWVVLFLGNLILRLVINYFVLGEPMSWIISIGVFLVVIGAYFVKIG